jgi:hypothetical protein
MVAEEVGAARVGCGGGGGGGGASEGWEGKGGGNQEAEAFIVRRSWARVLRVGDSALECRMEDRDRWIGCGIVRVNCLFFLFFSFLFFSFLFLFES